MLLHPHHGKFLVVIMVRYNYCIAFSRLTCICIKISLLVAGLRLFKEAKDWDSRGKVSCSFDHYSLIILINIFVWQMLLLSALGWSSSNNGSWCAWWNFRGHFPDSYVSWSLEIRVRTLKCYLYLPTLKFWWHGILTLVPACPLFFG